MNSSSTHITVILDRSGSMESIRDDTIGGFNAFLREQQELPGAATLTLIQFDSSNPYEVIHHFRPLTDVVPLTRETFVPRATTPLLDAIGRGINDLEEQLAKLAEKPAKVVMAIITDGEENASREFAKAQIAEMIRMKQTANGWQFVFLSADLAAVSEAQSLGVPAASSMAFDRSAQGAGDAFRTLSRNLASYRSGHRESVAFDADDRAKQESERKRS